MPQAESKHVSRMGRYLPFNPNHDQIYEEYQKSDDALDLHTKALDYILEVADRSQIIVLTGDAGHGKTHLCRRLLEKHSGYTQDEARHLINHKCDGEVIIEGKDEAGSSKPLRVYKDFSELTPIVAAQKVEEAKADTAVLTVICANEGRLRAVLEAKSDSNGCRELLNEFHSSFKSGLASTDGKVHMVNLNYQSVASEKSDALVTQALRSWLDRRRWTACNTCDSRQSCPIYMNFELLTVSKDAVAQSRVMRLKGLLAASERLGAVITMREMLMIVSFAITGGLLCADVHRRRRSGKRGWQHRYAFYNLLFLNPPTLKPEQINRIPALSRLKKLDPGMRASRILDEKLINELGVFPTEELDLCFQSPTTSSGYLDAADGIDDIVGNPRNKKERTKEFKDSVEVVRSLRRRAYFDGISKQANLLNALGFEYGDDFEKIMKGRSTGADMSRIKSRIVAGLHTIQGIQMQRQQPNLLLVDPAFGAATTHAAIISREIQPKNIKLVPMIDQWSIAEDMKQYAMSNAVDWIDRHVCFQVHSEDGDRKDFFLDLLAFDMISRASGGFVPEGFYAHDIRRTMNFLAQLTEESSRKEAEIKFFLKGELQSVAIDENVIQVGGAGL
jgi:hypothetical protein